jgi:hypothetical protein
MDGHMTEITQNEVHRKGKRADERGKRADERKDQMPVTSTTPSQSGSPQPPKPG